MEIFEKYKNGAYLRRLKAKHLLLSWDDDSKAIRANIADFFRNDRITISYSELQDVIAEVDGYKIDPDITIKVVMQKGNFDKTRESINSGVTTKLVFLFRTVVGGSTRWFLYALGSGLYNSTLLLNVTKSSPLGYTVYLAIFDRDSDSSKAVPTALERLREKIANKALDAQAAPAGTP